MTKKLDEKLNEKIFHLPTKNEFYNQMDQIMTELKAIRQKLTTHSYQITGHERRISKLEHHVIPKA